MAKSMQVNVGGVWKKATPHVNVNGTWKKVKKGYVNVGGTWKEFLSGIEWAPVAPRPVYVVPYGDSAGLGRIMSQEFGASAATVRYTNGDYIFTGKMTWDGTKYIGPIGRVAGYDALNTIIVQSTNGTSWSLVRTLGEPFPVGTPAASTIPRSSSATDGKGNFVMSFMTINGTGTIPPSTLIYTSNNWLTMGSVDAPGLHNVVYHPATDKFYGVVLTNFDWNAEVAKIVTINPSTGAMTNVKTNIPGKVNQLVATDDGLLYSSQDGFSAAQLRLLNVETLADTFVYSAADLYFSYYGTGRVSESGEVFLPAGVGTTPASLRSTDGGLTFTLSTTGWWGGAQGNSCGFKYSGVSSSQDRARAINSHDGLSIYTASVGATGSSNVVRTAYQATL